MCKVALRATHVALANIKMSFQWEVKLACSCRQEAMTQMFSLMENIDEYIATWPPCNMDSREKRGNAVINPLNMYHLLKVDGAKMRTLFLSSLLNGNSL